MIKCPYCGCTLHLKDFFTTEKRFFKDKIEFKGEQFKIAVRESQISRTTLARMWSCPECEALLGFSEVFLSSGL